MECAPARGIVQLHPLIERHAGRIGNVRRESLFGLEDGEEFVPDVVGGGLDRVEPGKIGAIEELDRCKAWIMINLGSRLVPSLPADHDVEGVAKPLQILARKRLVIGVQVLIQERPEFPPVLFPIR